MRRAWGRYHLISDALQNNLPSHMDPHLADRISRSLQHEPTLLIPEIPGRRALLRPLAGLAVAASVAAMAIVGIQYGRQGAAPLVPGPEVAADFVIDRLPAASGGRLNLAAGGGDSRRTVAPVAHGYSGAQMNRYLVNYNEYRRSAAMQGMLPYVRIVADEQDR